MYRNMSNARDTAGITNQIIGATDYITAAIAIKVNSFNTIQSTPVNYGATTSITAQPGQLRIRGNGGQVMMETQCGSFDPCTIVQAMNRLGQMNP